MTSQPDAARRRVERIYPLSPLQAGMGFHAMLDDGPDAYVESVSFALVGELDVEAFRAAWAAVMGRHAALHTSVHWTEQAEARQVVHRRLDLPWTEHDWRATPATEHEERLAELWQ